MRLVPPGELTGFLTAWIGDPWEGTHRAAMADYLEDRGDPRAALLRVVPVLAGVADDSPVTAAQLEPWVSAEWWTGGHATMRPPAAPHVPAAGNTDRVVDRIGRRRTSPVRLLAAAYLWDSYRYEPCMPDGRPPDGRYRLARSMPTPDARVSAAAAGVRWAVAAELRAARLADRAWVGRTLGAPWKAFGVNPGYPFYDPSGVAVRSSRLAFVAASNDIVSSARITHGVLPAAAVLRRHWLMYVAFGAVLERSGYDPGALAEAEEEAKAGGRGRVK